MDNLNRQMERHLDIRPFSFESGQDINLWLKRYMRNVDACLKADATENDKKAAYLRLLPTKLDDFALSLFESSQNNTSWDGIKDELIQKFSDPAKSQRFQTQLDAIKWDPDQPLHLYENKIISSIQQHDAEIAANDSLFEREIFKRFLAGLPQDYQTYVDAGLPVRCYDVAKARERAEKYKDLLSKNKGIPPLASWLGSGLPTPTAAAAAIPAALAANAATFAAFKNPAMESLTEQISALNIAHKETLEAQKETNRSINSLIEQLSSRPSREEFRRPPPSPGGNRGNFTRAFSGQSPHRSPYRSPGRSYDYQRPQSNDGYSNQQNYPRSNYPPNNGSYNYPPRNGPQQPWGHNQQSNYPPANYQQQNFQPAPRDNRQHQQSFQQPHPQVNRSFQQNYRPQQPQPQPHQPNHPPSNRGPYPPSSRPQAPHSGRNVEYRGPNSGQNRGHNPSSGQSLGPHGAYEDEGASGFPTQPKQVCFEEPNEVNVGAHYSSGHYSAQFPCHDQYSGHYASHEQEDL